MSNIHCPLCSTINEATVHNDVLRPGALPCIGPVWQCTICECQWTDEIAGEIIDMFQKENK